MADVREEIYRKYKVIIYNYFYKAIFNTHSAEDLAEFDVPEPTDMSSDADERITIKLVMDKLQEEERSLIILRDVNGLTYAEIAQIMNCTEGKVKIGLHRSRKKFKELYKIHCEEGIKIEAGL